MENKKCEYIKILKELKGRLWCHILGEDDEPLGEEEVANINKIIIYFESLD